MFQGKPIIGIAGGIGSGKSFVADLFGEMGALVIKADKLVHNAYHQADVRKTLRQWWGDEVFESGEAHTVDTVDTKAIARKIFGNATERKRLEDLLHPMVTRARDEQMRQAMVSGAPPVVFVWDTPLLFETGIDRECDAVIFVDAPWEVRLARVAASRGWNQAELARRENLQMPLDRKREISHYVVENTADAEKTRGQVREILSRILANSVQRVTPDRSGGF